MVKISKFTQLLEIAKVIVKYLTTADASYRNKRHRKLALNGIPSLAHQINEIN